MAVRDVPITPSVLAWAIKESGYEADEVAIDAGVLPSDLEAWLEGRAFPGVTAVRDLARVLRRPVATFLLPAPPPTESPRVKFRHTPGASSRKLSATELRYLRKATRIQRTIAWLATEMKEPRPQISSFSLDGDAIAAGRAVRAQLGIDFQTQFEWSSVSVAFDAWREAIERVGVAVFLFSLGTENCRGFSVAHKTAPLIAVNTAWNDSARIFTLFHELGHLVTGTSSACSTAPPASVAGAWDPAERWCENFAAAALIPDGTVRSLLRDRYGPVTRVDDVGPVRYLARRYHVSLRAVTLRLIELGLAHWDLYRSLPPGGDAKQGGGGGKGRDRLEIQQDQLGGRATRLFERAVKTDVMSRSEALLYLDIPDAALDSLAGASA